MEQASGLVAVLGVLMLVYYFLLGRRVGVGKVLSPSGQPVETTMGGSAVGFLEGLIAVLALSELAAIGDASSGAFSGGALLGGAAALGLVVRRWWPGELGLGLLYGILGLVASVPAMARLFDASECDVGVDHWMRIAALVVLAVTWGGGLIAGLLFRWAGSRRPASAGLALFGAIEVVVFMSGPVGVGISPQVAGLLIAAAAVLGGLSGYRPDLVMMTSGLFLGTLVIFETSTGFPQGCDSLKSDAPYAALVGYCVVFWAGAWVVSKFSRAR